MSGKRIPEAFLRWGYLQAKLDALGRLQSQLLPDLERTDEASKRGRAIYCGSIGVEFMHIPCPKRRCWVQERMESDAPEPDRSRVLDRLIRADMFERVLQTRYLGTKRYSLEGATALIPLLDEVLEEAASHGVEQVVLGMSHRGRLNVMVNILEKRPEDIFAGFEDVDPRSVLGAGDVKYHIGATGEYTDRTGRRMRISLVSNPSHLEAVDPVVMGRARAKQDRLGEGGRARILPITLHGDAAFAGQGIVAETLNLANLRGFHVGGTVHVIVNNLIGFTTTPRDLHSSRYASDVAKRLPIPIFHVNGEDLDAVVKVARLAAEYRYTFWSDVVVDLIGYRLHGHSEVEDPTTTQPVLYARIQGLPPLWQAYARGANGDSSDAEALAQQIRTELERQQERARHARKKPVLRELPEYWSAFEGGCYQADFEVDTGVPLERLKQVTERITRPPEGFHTHPKVKRGLEQRQEMTRGKRLVDWGTGEALAFGTLLWEGTRVRLSGEDSRRGTFNQRHAVLIDLENEEEYVPLQHLHPEQGAFECYDTPLSEAAVLGYEFGYSRDYPEALVIWEAQFGDFTNGAQVIIDQFVSATENKWGLLSGLVMLLPHGYEGQGPEHSSARAERFLQLAAEDNLQICQPSTSGQYFHLLRRQVLRPWRKPLVVLTPKGMLRDRRACSSVEALTQGRFLTVIPDSETAAAQRVLVCTGKIGHELRAERERRADTSTAIVMLEQLYPFPEQELARELERHARAREVVWVQEEPANMGPSSFVLSRLRRLSSPLPLRSIKRSASGSPATGSAKANAIEQATLLALAFTRRQ